MALEKLKRKRNRKPGKACTCMMSSLEREIVQNI